MNRLVKLAAALLTAAALALPIGGQAFSAAAESVVSAPVSGHTRQEIAAKYKKLGLGGFDQRNAEFSEEPLLTEPYSPGSLSAKSRKKSLALLNFIRYTAGLPEVKQDSGLNYQAQCTALLFAINGCQSYQPKRPEGISDEIYDAAVSGADSRYSMPLMGGIDLTLVKSMLADSGQYDISDVADRRKLLSPQLEKVGFGYADVFSVVQLGMSDGEFDGDYIAWPPENMPMELYMPDFNSNRYAFSVTLGTGYDLSRLSKARATVTLVNTGKTWKLSPGKNTGSKRFYTDGDSIIFDTGYTYSSGDTVRVEITGLTKNGEPADISYEVNFFTMCPDISDCGISAIPDQVYTGKKLSPALDITFDGKKLVKGSDYTVKYTKNKSVGIAVAEIKGKGRFSGKQTVFFNIVPKKQKITSLTGGTGDFTVSWKPDKNAVFYKVQYSRSKNMSGARTITSAAYTGSCTMNCWLGVKPGKYYVRVCSGVFGLGDEALGPWSDISTVTVR